MFLFDMMIMDKTIILEPDFSVGIAGKYWGQEEKGMTEDEMAEWHHRLNGHGFGWTPGVGDGQGSLACYGSWGHKESDTTERLNWTELKVPLLNICINDDGDLSCKSYL